MPWVRSSGSPKRRRAARCGWCSACARSIAQHVSAVVPGAAGAVSITLLTGITTGIPAADHDAFRASGLAHLLAVAGLHIGIVMGWALAFARLAFAASEHASLHWPTKKLAALAALSSAAATWC